MSLIGIVVLFLYRRFKLSRESSSTPHSAEVSQSVNAVVSGVMSLLLQTENKKACSNLESDGPEVKQDLCFSSRMLFSRRALKS